MADQFHEVGVIDVAREKAEPADQTAESAQNEAAPAPRTVLLEEGEPVPPMRDDLEIRQIDSTGRPNKAYLDRGIKIQAARLVVELDKKLGKDTEAWIAELATEDTRPAPRRPTAGRSRARRRIA